jgi:hypothetical protein
VVALVPDLAPRKAWLCDADRWAVIDDEAAVALSDGGADGARVQAVGPVAPRARVDAAKEDRAALRSRFRIPEGKVALVLANGMGVETLSQILLQLALLEQRVFTLFDVGDDAAAAAHLRRQVPSLGLRGKLFGEIADAPLLWRCADVVVARPRVPPLHAAATAGCLVAALEPRGDEISEARALAERGMGGAIPQALLLAASLDPLLARRPPAPAALDGAAEVARLCAQVAADREAVLEETFAATRSRAEERRQAAAAEEEREARRDAPAGGLEDLGDDDDEPLPQAAPRGPDKPTMDRLRAELTAAEARARKELEDARAEAEKWDQRRVLAERKGDARLAAEAAREADRKRARMHAALEELARIGREKQRLGTGAGPAAPPPKGPTIDDELAKMKKKAGKTVDDELQALKRKMATEKKK